MPIIPYVIEQHAEETAFLWVLRNNAVRQPHYDLKDLMELDERVEAHIDGLRIAGEPGWEICQVGLKWNEAGEVFTAAVIAFESAIPNRMNKVLDVVDGNIELQRAWISALGWIDSQKTIKPVEKLIHAHSPELKFVGIASHAVHRRDPGVLLSQSIHNENPTVRARSIKACGEIGRRDLLYEILDHLNDHDQKCRFYAAWAATILGSSQSVEVLRAISSQDVCYSEKASSMAIRKMPNAEAHDWLKHIGQKSDQIRQAIIASGALGDPVVMPSLLKAMQIPKLARPAGESFSMITGVDIAYDDLDAEWPDGFEAGPSENPEDEDVELDPDEDLPWPEHELIHKWWNDNKQNFRNGTRYLCGKPISEKQCQHVLKYGYQRQREAAATELAMMKPGQPLFFVQAPGFRQKMVLGIK